MEILLEIILEIILNGMFETVSAKEIPMFIRVLLAVLLLVIYSGFFLLIVSIGIEQKSIFIFAIGIFIFAFFVIEIIRAFKKVRKK